MFLTVFLLFYICCDIVRVSWLQMGSHVILTWPVLDQIVDVYIITNTMFECRRRVYIELLLNAYYRNLRRFVANFTKNKTDQCTYGFVRPFVLLSSFTAVYISCLPPWLNVLPELSLDKLA